MYFEIRKQKYLEALDRFPPHPALAQPEDHFVEHFDPPHVVVAALCRKDHIGAIKILKKDLRIFQALNQEIFNELTSLLTLDDFRLVPWVAGFG